MASAQELRIGVEGIASRAVRELDPIWARTGNANAARRALRSTLPRLVRAYSVAAATWAADWYDSDRYDAAVGGSFQPVTPTLGDAGAQALAAWGVGPLYHDEPDWDAAATLIAGGLQRRIANAARLTIAASAAQDPYSQGWQRVGSGNCDLCRILIRGADLHRTGITFVAHDHCRCEAVPAWVGQPLPVKAEPLGPPINRADAARAKAYLRHHQTTPARSG